jgi:glucosamine-6-phosphate deaminase
LFDRGVLYNLQTLKHGPAARRRVFFMLIKVFDDRVALGLAAAGQAAAAIRRGIAERGNARIIAATAASQLEFLDALTKAPEIDWSRV